MNEISKPSPNFSSREGYKPDSIIIHDTEGQFAGALSWLCDPASKVSAHVLINRAGEVYRLVPDEQKAWHAGASSLWGDSNINERSLGVELEDTSDQDPYPQAQLDACVQWCAEKAKQYRIPLNRIVGHEHVAPKRKHDPGPDWDWFENLRAIGRKMDQLP